MLAEVSAGPIATHCPYCSLQCGIDLAPSDDGSIELDRPGLPGQPRRALRQGLAPPPSCSTTRSG